MKWIEWIHLRCLTVNERIKAESAFAEIKGDLSEDGLLKSFMFVNKSYSNDAVLSLHWDCTYPESGSSRLGEMFVAMLKEFGMVHKTSWINIEEALGV